MEPVLLWIAIIVAPLISAGIVGIAMSLIMDRERTRLLGEIRSLSTRHLSALKQLQSENARALQALKAEWTGTNAAPGHELSGPDGIASDDASTPMPEGRVAED
jgi:hypothetical protein